MGYRYEMHSHTASASMCSSMTAEDFVKLYTKLDYAGIFITDHFPNVNTTEPENLTWEERVDILFSGYSLVKTACASHGIQVFFAFEYSCKGTDFLMYGLGRQWLLEHKEIIHMKPKQVLNIAAKDGALVCQAHPYREAHYIDHIRLFPSDIQAVEAYNSSRDSRCNNLGNLLAEAYKLPCIGGSDIHSMRQKEISGMEFETKAKTEYDIIHWILEGKGTILHLNNPYLDSDVKN